MFDKSCPNKNVKIEKLDIKKPYITSEIKRLIESSEINIDYRSYTTRNQSHMVLSTGNYEIS